MKPEKRKADAGARLPKGESGGNQSTGEVGLKKENNPIAGICANIRNRAIVPVSVRSNGCELGGLRFLRRLTATPGMSARGVSFCGDRAHGASASVYLYGLMPCGKSNDLSLPKERSANPRGVSLPLGGWWGTRKNLSLGASAMMRNFSSVASVEAQSPAVYSGAVSTNPAINRPSVSESVGADVSAIIAACRQASSIASGRCREAVRMQVLSFLRDVAQFKRAEVCHG